MNKYIDADKLTKAIEDKGLDCSFALKMERLDMLALIDELKQEQPEGLHFTPLNRLIQKIPSGNWNDTVNNYARKLRDCLIKEGYRKDAEVLQGHISYMNGNNVPMATMDEQEQPHFAGASKMEQPVEGLEELRKEVIKFSQDHFDELHSDMETIDIVHIIACHFAEWQKKQDQELIELAEDHAMLAGMNKMKEQMMEKAIEGKVFMSFAPGHNQVVMADVDLPTNTKVKVIIVKEDEK